MEGNDQYNHTSPHISAKQTRYKQLHRLYICHFFYTGRIFESQILHPKITKNTQKYKKYP